MRVWNGRGFKSNGDSIYVAACSRREAARLLAMAANVQGNFQREVDDRDIGIWDRELKTYFSECWGNAMDGITPEKGVWYQEKYTSIPIKLRLSRSEQPTTVKASNQ